MNSGISPLLLASGGISNTVAAVSGPVAAANLTAAAAAATATTAAAPPGFLGAIFNRRERKLSKSDESGTNVSATVSIQPTNNIDRSTEV